MKIAVLGGAGDMGSRTVEELAQSPAITQITICDRDMPAAERLRARIEGAPARIELCAVDAGDPAGLVAALRGHDVTASALGPFHRFEAPCMRASIEAGVPYASLCDDWSASAEVLGGLQEAARRAGVVCLTGIGASPGLTNILAAFLAQGLGPVRRIDVYLFCPWSAGGGEGVLRHLLFVVNGEIAAFRDGRACRVPACTERAVVDLPHYGPCALYNMGHSEPVSLPARFPELETCNFFMGMGAGTGLLAAAARRGWFRQTRNVDRVWRLVRPFEGWIAGRPHAPCALRVDVWGAQADGDVQRSAFGFGGMRDATGLALAVGALQLAQGPLAATEAGVYAPEDCLAIAPFLEAMRQRGMTAYRDVALTDPIV
jgi:saccharopine dehydrogenase-like NADP-dependent oxidoreductase